MPPLRTSCAGPIRREFLCLGLTGFAGLTWPGLLRLRAETGTDRTRPSKALLVVWLHGGASHFETYDPKPEAPIEYRGPYRPIATTVPGLRISELLPEQARVAHQFTLLRSLAHTGPCHDSGPQQLFTSFPTTVNRLKPDHTDLFAVVDRLRSDPTRPLPNNSGVPPIPYLGAAYLGPAHEPFGVHGDPNDPRFEAVLAAYPPEGFKDWRDWVRELLAGQAELELAAVGETIRAHVETTAVVADAKSASTEAGAGKADQSVGELQVESLEGLRPKPIVWLVPNRIPAGMLGLLAGENGHGKSVTTLEIAAGITSPRPLQRRAGGSHRTFGRVYRLRVARARETRRGRHLASHRTFTPIRRPQPQTLRSLVAFLVGPLLRRDRPPACLARLLVSDPAAWCPELPLARQERPAPLPHGSHRHASTFNCGVMEPCASWV